jgi:WD40 repeat protein
VENKYQPLLAILAVAREPLSREQLEGFGDQAAHLMGGRMSATLVNLALGVLIQFLDSRGEPGQEQYSLFHQSLRDYLGDRSRSGRFACPQKDGHGAIAGYYLEHYVQDWRECDIYGLRHVVRHLVSATMWNELTRLLGVFPFLEAKTSRLGIYTLLNDIQTSLSELPLTHPSHQELRDLLRLLNKEAHNLLDWDSSTQPAFFVQQVHNRSIVEGIANMAKAARERLSQIRKPHFALRFRLSKESPAFLRALSGNGPPLMRLAVSPDGSLALAGSNEFLKIWDIETGEQVRTFDGRWDSIGFTPSGEHAVLFHEGSIVLWDIRGDKQARIFHGGVEWAQAMGVSGGYALCASIDHQLKLVDLATGEVVLHCSGPGNPIKYLVWTPDGRQAISAVEVDNPSGNEGVDTISAYLLQRWNLENGQELIGFGAHPYIRDLAVTPDSGRLIASVGNETIAVWDLHTGQKSEIIAGCFPGALTISPDSRILVYANAGGDPFELKILDLQTNNELETLSAHPYPSLDLAITPEGRYLVSICGTGEIKVWDWQVIQSSLAKSIKLPSGTRAWVQGITPDGCLGILATEENSLLVVKLDTGKQPYGWLEGHRDIIRGVVFTSDSRLAVSGSQDGVLKVWDLSLGKGILDLPYYGWSMKRAFALLPGDQLLLAATQPGELKVWNLKTGHAVGEPLYVPGEARVILLTSDGKRAVIASQTTITVWSMETRQLLYTLESQHEIIEELVLTRDDQFLFSFGTYENSVGRYDLFQGKVLPPLIGHSSWVRAVALTADGQYALSCSNDNSIIVWKWRTPEEAGRLVGHTDWVYDMELTQDEQRAFSVSQDRTVRVWDWKMGTTLALACLDSILIRVRIALTGQRILVGDRTGSVYCLDYLEQRDDTEIVD